MDKWSKRKREGELKKSHIRILEIDCEMFGEYQSIVNKIFENNLIWNSLTEDEQSTFRVGQRVLGDFYWFGWEEKNLKKVK